MILVTGATGFVGQRVVARLATYGYEVRCLVRPAYKERRLPPGVRVHMVTGGLVDPPALRVALQRVETIVHLATIWRERGPRTFDWVNRQGTLNLIEAAHEVGASRIILMSHPAADGNSAYAFLRSKGLAEEAVKSSGLRFTILRPSWVYGPGDGWTTRLAAGTVAYEVSRCQPPFTASTLPEAAGYCRANYPGKEKLYWYDSWPHPNDSTLAATHPHHKHILPNIKHHRVPAPDLSFARPNLPALIVEIERDLLHLKREK